MKRPELILDLRDKLEQRMGEIGFNAKHSENLGMAIRRKAIFID